MLDKNPGRSITYSLEKIQTDLAKHSPSIVLTSRPFHKAELIRLLLESADYPATLLDFDLLYSGYVASHMVQKKDTTSIICPQKQNWKRTMHDVLVRMSEERHMIIIDSFNGFHNMYSYKESARFVNASLMLLASVGRFKKCPVVAMAYARKNMRNQWVLHPGGRQIASSKNSALYHLEKDNDMLHVTPLEDTQ